MTGARRQRDSMAPSLFPFLAVLLCTMGSLVLILMLVVSGAQASAKRIETQSQHRVEEIEATLELAQKSYQRQLADGRIDLEKKRLALQHFEEHIHELLTELEDLKKTSELLDEEVTSEEAEMEELQRRLTDLEKQLAEASEELKQNVEKPDGDKPIFAVIPYDGPHGTHRRPIYIECLEQGVKIQPEGVLVSIEDLQPPHGPGNPLDAALRTIRSEFSPANGAVTSTAYPLLIVRPSGIRSYSLARSAMSGWDDQFGYELIDEELDLVFPESKRGLRKKIVQALELARQRQSALVMAMPRKYRAFADGLGRNASKRETGGTRSGMSSYPGQDSLTGPNLPAGEPSGRDPAVNSANGSDSGRSGRIGSGMTGDGKSDWENALSDPAKAALLGDLALNQSANSGSPLGDSGWNDPSALGEGADGQFLEGASGNNQKPHRSGSEHGLNHEMVRSGFAAGGAVSDLAMPRNGGLTGGSSYFGDSTASGSTGSQGDGGSVEAGSRSGNATDETQRSNQAFGYQSSTSSQESANSAGSQQAGSQAAASSSAFSTDSTASSGSGSASGASSTPGGNAFSVPDVGLSSSESPPNAMPEVTIGQRQSSEEAQPIASSRGEDWAWSRGSFTQTPVVRPIHLHCFSDRWILLPENGDVERALTISFDASPSERAKQLARAILDRVDSWGLALTGGYWKPVLIVDAAPNAARRFHELVQMLEGSGLEVRLRQSRQPPRR